MKWRLRFGVGSTEGRGRTTHTFRGSGLRRAEIDGAEFIFVLHHVVLEGEEKTLSALGSEDLACIDTSLGQTGESGDEVEYEFLGAVVDDGQVAVSAVSQSCRPCRPTLPLLVQAEGVFFGTCPKAVWSERVFVRLTRSGSSIQTNRRRNQTDNHLSYRQLPA